MNERDMDIFAQLDEKGVHTTPEQRQRIKKRINDVLTYEPKVGVFGKTGVGKSSLCNALFGQDVCPISDVEACTRDTQNVLLKMGSKKITLIDVPGAGESIERDKEYAALYKKLLPELDVVLWLIKADDRALASDETFFKNVVQPCLEKKPDMVFFFVLNQCDKLEPIREWNEAEHEPGAHQLVNIERKREDVANHFNIAPSKVIAVSANEKYHLVELIDEIVYALPKDKKITLTKNAAEENVSQRARTEAENGFFDTVKEIVKDVAGVVVDKIKDAGRAILDFFRFW